MSQNVNVKRSRVRWVILRLLLVLFDIFAVNFAYFIALVVRFYVNHEFDEFGLKYIPAFLDFAPWYTLCCLIIFAAFKLYNSRWKYAGLNDLNRIISACILTCMVQIVGSLVFVLRMPITYYFIGAVIQFGMIAVSRFSYRLFLLERSRVRSLKSATSIPVMIVGCGETSSVVRRHMERDNENMAQPVCLVDLHGKEYGNMLGGLPVINGVEQMEDAITKYGVECVILADSTMSAEARKTIRQLCAKKDVQLQDFSGFFGEGRGRVTLRNLLEYAKGEVELVVDGSSQRFLDAEQAMLSVNGKYVVKSVFAKENCLVIELQQDILVPNDVKEDWVSDYKKETGEDVSFF